MKIFLLCITFIAACKPIGDDASQTQGRDTYAWFKEPAVIRNTIIKTWGIEITREDDIRYFARLGQLYGAVDPITARVLLRAPSGTYVLALDMVSRWISNLLLEKQMRDESAPPPVSNLVFHGQIGFPLQSLSDKEDCFDNTEKNWCDTDDKITTGMYSAKDKERLLDPDLASSDRKRLMHNIQDIGDFLGVTIDNLLTITDSKYSHVPHYLLDEIFIPNLDDAPDCTNEKSSDNLNDTNPLPRCDIRAWKQVVYAILMSGQFFMYLPNRSVGEAI